MMQPFGVMILFDPAILCLASGSALAATGAVWMLLIRKLAKKKAFAIAIPTFLAFATGYLLTIQICYGAKGIHFELIRGLL